jgi:hypothetical protein
MKITIAATPTVVEIDGKKCRLWNGTMPDGAPCQVFVRGIAVTGADAAANNLEQLQEQSPPVDVEDVSMYSIRDQVLHFSKLHERHCRHPNCMFKGNLLAFLGHTIGLNRDDVRHFETLLVRYDIECPHNEGCISPKPERPR